LPAAPTAQVDAQADKKQNYHIKAKSLFLTLLPL